MSYTILVFTQHPLTQTRLAQDLLTALRAVHYESLCQQYGLDTALIAPTLKRLSIEQSRGAPLPYFLFHYREKSRPALIVSEWKDMAAWQVRFLADKGTARPPVSARAFISKAQAVYGVALEESQLTDLGLLLAYEIARWLTERGPGIMLGVDGVWYRLNRHQAFLPMC
ncbi:MAG: hypothetical protein GX142_06315 [Chloroflexi bacterium]|jgi:hypothetical protein|nr:hypothetical protein [Chloroflexota bacterium]